MQVLALVTWFSLCGLSAGFIKKAPIIWPKVNGLGRMHRTCPCPNPTNCKPVTRVAKEEGFAFAVANSNYMKYDWTKITTLVVFSAAVNDTLMCYAHSKGARITYGADFPVGNLTNPGDRKAWVAQQVKFAQEHYMDGINLDFESGIAAGDVKKREGLNSLVQELTLAFKSAFPNPQVTFDVENNPYGDRRYDYAFIGKTMDFLLIMAYDETGSCATGANSGYETTANGTKKFLALGIPAEKLVLGLPWYGYDYPCSTIDKYNKCTIHPSCGGRQLSYDATYRTAFKTTTSGLIWDKKSSTPFFNYKDANTGMLRQAWCDNVESLTLKYKWAVANNLRGLGMWHADTLLYDDSPEGHKQRAQMWGAMPTVN